MKRKLSTGASNGPSDLGGFLPTPKSSGPLLSPDRADGHPSKIRRRGSKIVAILRSLTTSGSSKSSQLPGKEHRPLTPDLILGDRVTVHTNQPLPSRGIMRKVSTSIFRSPMDQHTIVHRTTHKNRPSILLPSTGVVPSCPEQTMLESASVIAASTTNSSTNSGNSAKFFNQGPVSTAKTSVDSKLSISPQPPIIRQRHSSQQNKSSLDNHDLGPIQESGLDQVMPTVATVERVAAAKIFLETYFNETAAGRSSPRSLRRRLLETDLYRYSQYITHEAADGCRKQFFAAESAHLRETRALRAKGTRARESKTGYDGSHHNPPTSIGRASTADDYEIMRNLGKGSYGVVRLVRARSEVGRHHSRKPVYAMKVIRKSAMVRTSQEGHLRAERDFLVASEGSKWIIPLISSFQDSTNLYLVMEYMPGGDFLGYLIRQNILPEHMARHYIAEMVMCIEEAHTLRCIHRDIKPENFLISPSGHLKISDFGLAFDGHWSHDASYFNNHRYSLLDKLGIQVDGDALDQTQEGIEASTRWIKHLAVGMERHERQSIRPDPDEDGASGNNRHQEPLLSWRNRCGNRATARSIVGTSQYMAPEVVMGEPYDARITFTFPSKPPISNRCRDFIINLICEKENRVCSRRYKLNDPLPRHPTHGVKTYQTTTRYVYPHDAEDIKCHKFFRGIDWNRLQDIPPPFVPRIRTEDDTRYFEDEDEISDWSASGEEESEPELDCNCLVPTRYDQQPQHQSPAANNDQAAEPRGKGSAMTEIHAQIQAGLGDASTSTMQSQIRITPTGHVNHAHLQSNRPQTRPAIAAGNATPNRDTTVFLALSIFPRELQPLAQSYIATPFDGTRLRRIEREINRLPGTTPDERDTLLQFVRRFGKRERRRPRDRLLRDHRTRDTVMKVRKRDGFLGYTWCRRRRNGRLGVEDFGRGLVSLGIYIGDGGRILSSHGDGYDATARALHRL